MPERVKMTKKIQAVLFAVLVAFVFCVSGAEAKIIIPSQEADKTVSESKLRNQIEFLSDKFCNGRGVGTQGSQETIFYLIRRFRSIGILPVVDGGRSYVSHFHTYAGPVGRNVMGMLPCSKDSSCDSYIIVTAHFDGLGVINGTMYPGADCNASGVAAMLTLGEMFKKMNSLRKYYGKNVVFVALDAKNLNMKGSDHLWKMIEHGLLVDPLSRKVIRKEKISMMVNIDQIGSTLSPINKENPDYMLMLGGDVIPKYYKDAFETVRSRWGQGMDICYDYYGSKDFTRLFYYRLSDQRRFIENNIPSVMFTSGITMNNNKTRDTVDSLDMAILRKRIIMIFHFLERVI